MANLEMAIQLAKSNKKPLNKVLFAFWGAEELGLLGSTHFVQRLTQEDAISDISLNLNFDMIVSYNSCIIYMFTRYHTIMIGIPKLC